MKRNVIQEKTCPLNNAVAALANKWKPIIVCIIKERTLRFGQIASRLPIISRKVLTDQLRELEVDGLVARQEFKELPPRVEYRLTPKGLELLPILQLLEEWEARHAGEPVGVETGIPS